MTSLKYKTVSGIKWNTFAIVIKLLIQILQLAVLTRLLDKSDFGIIAVATMVIGFTDLFSGLGFSVAIIHKQTLNQYQYSSIFWMNIIMGVSIFFILWLMTPLIAFFYKEPILNSVIPLLGVQIIISSFGKMFMSLKTRDLEFKFISITAIISVVLGFVLSVVLALYGAGVYSLVFGQLFQTSILQLTYFIAEISKNKIRFYLNINEIKDFLKIGGYQLGSQILDFITIKVDIFLIGRFFGMDNLGVYNLAKELVAKPAVGITALIANVATAAFAKIQYDLSLMKKKYGEILKLLTTITFPMYVVLFVFADPIVSVLYDSTFSEVSTFTKILTITGIVTAIGAPVGIITVALGRTDLGFKWTIIRIIISTLAVVFSSFIGFQAVAYSISIVSVISFFLYWRIVLYAAIKITLAELINMFKLPALFSLIAGLPFLLLTNLFHFTILNQVIQVFVFIILYFFIQWYFDKNFVVNTKKMIFNK